MSLVTETVTGENYIAFSKGTDFMGQYDRTALLIGDEGIEKLKKSRVAVFGIGGVGSFVAEALARAGVGTIALFDNDTVSESNINRQLIALHSTVGRSKTEVMAERIADINPDIKVIANNLFYSAETADIFNPADFDYVVDAIDTVSSKLLLIERCEQTKTPIISCMGTGNHLDPSKFSITDINKTSVCPLARVMRLELKKRGIKKLKVLYSTEQPVKPEIDETLIKEEQQKGSSRRQIPGSISFVPSVAGLMIAGEVIKELIK